MRTYICGVIAWTLLLTLLASAVSAINTGVENFGRNYQQQEIGQ